MSDTEFGAWIGMIAVSLFILVGGVLLFGDARAGWLALAALAVVLSYRVVHLAGKNNWSIRITRGVAK